MTEATSRQDTAPQRGSDGFNCPRCDAYAHQEWYVLKREYDDENHGEWTSPAYDTANPAMLNLASGTPLPPAQAAQYEDNLWTMSQCGRCHQFATWRGDRMMYPEGNSFAPPPHEDMPDEAKQLYREAAAVVGISPRAGAAFARATLELLLKKLDPMEGRIDLATRIEHVLATVGAKSPLGRMLTVIRHTGNKSVHVEEQPDAIMVQILDPEQPGVLDMIFRTINDLVEQLVAYPQKVEDLFESVPEEVRSQVGKPPKPTQTT